MKIPEATIVYLPILVDCHITSISIFIIHFTIGKYIKHYYYSLLMLIKCQLLVVILLITLSCFSSVFCGLFAFVCFYLDYLYPNLYFSIDFMSTAH